jgi:DNA modification methylase
MGVAVSIQNVLSGQRRWHVQHGDSLELCRALPAECVDAIVTDPPYLNTNESTSFVVTGAGKQSVPRETQFFEAWLREHLVEWVRVLKPTGGIWCTLDWRGAMALDMACCKLGLRAPRVGVWHRKHLGMGHLLRRTYETFVVVTKPDFERRASAEPDVWEHPWSARARKHGHPAEKPTELLCRAVRLLCDPGALVLDPFAGSGSTCVAALTEKCRALGFERDEDFAITARTRCKEAA